MHVPCVEHRRIIPGARETHQTPHFFHFPQAPSSIHRLPKLVAVLKFSTFGAPHRVGSLALQQVLSKAEEKGVVHLDLSWNPVDRTVAGEDFRALRSLA